MPETHSPDLERMQKIWPELNETMRSNLLALASLSLLKHGKLGAGVLTLGSSLRLRGGLFLRRTRDEIIMIGKYVGDLVRHEEENLLSLNSRVNRG